MPLASTKVPSFFIFGAAVLIADWRVHFFVVAELFLVSNG